MYPFAPVTNISGQSCTTTAFFAKGFLIPDRDNRRLADRFFLLIRLPARPLKEGLGEGFMHMFIMLVQKKREKINKQ